MKDNIPKQEAVCMFCEDKESESTKLKEEKNGRTRKATNRNWNKRS